MKIKEQRNLIRDIFPPQISKPVMRHNRDFFADFQTVSRYISILLIGLLVFMPLSPVFAEETAELLLEEGLASTTEKSLINEPVGEFAEDGTGEIVEEQVMGTSTEEVINSIIGGVVENNEITENTDMIVEFESGTATSSEAVENLQEENNDEIVIVANTGEILISNVDISSSSPETTEDLAGATNVGALANVSDSFLADSASTSVMSSVPNGSLQADSATTTAGQASLLQAGFFDFLQQGSGQVAQDKSGQIELQLAPEPFNAQDPFAGKECIYLNNGDDFYCFKSNKESNASTSIENLGTIEKGKVSSIRDSDGDREIFLYTNGKSVQITNNNWDDLFPAQDVSSLSIVWQSLINDRWQIMFYDQGMATTTQITDSNFNNMMPRIYGDIIVWQGWPQDNWEIFYAKKNNNDEWIVKQITNNDYPDMFPKVMGNNIVWQAFSSEGGSAPARLASQREAGRSGGKDGGWHIFTYDIKSDAITKISATGIKNENPKFMIVWEEKGNGTTTRAFGYDLSSGEVVELNNNEKPQEIPEPPLKNDAALPISTTTPNKLENEESD